MYAWIGLVYYAVGSRDVCRPTREFLLWRLVSYLLIQFVQHVVENLQTCDSIIWRHVGELRLLSLIGRSKLGVPIEIPSRLPELEAEANKRLVQ
jgi:hypothetical protein